MQKDRPLRRSTKHVGEEDEILACLPVIIVNIDKVNSGQAQRQLQPEAEDCICHVLASADGQTTLYEASMARYSFIGDLWHNEQRMAPQRKASIFVFPDEEGLEMLRLGAKEGWSEDFFIDNGYGMVSPAPLSTTRWWTGS